MTTSTRARNEILTSRGVALDVADERGYRRYERGELEPILEADPRLAANLKLRRWVGRYARQQPGIVMPKYALPGSAFLAPLAQLRPDKAVRVSEYDHDHADLGEVTRRRHEEAEHGGNRVGGEHHHVVSAKYLLVPGSHGKRW